MKTSFILHIDSLHILNKLNYEQKGILFDAIYRYHLGEDLELDPIIDIAFSSFKCQFDRDLKKYNSVVERNQINGLKGGRPKSTDNQTDVKKPKITQKNQLGLLKTQANPKNLDSDSDSDSDSVSESDNDSVNENDKEKIRYDGSDKPNILMYKIDFNALLTFFNQNFGKQTRVFPDPIKKKYVLLLKKGYSKEDIIIAMRNAASDEFHINNGYKHCTLEFFSRPDKIEKFSTMLEPKHEKKEYREYSMRKSFS